VRVLVVDDDPAVLGVVPRLLARLGHEPSVAADHAGAVARIGAGGVDLVLLDARLGGGEDGAACLRALRALDPELRIIACSGFGTEGPARELLDAGANGFLEKPFRLAELAARLDETAARP